MTANRLTIRPLAGSELESFALDGFVVLPGFFSEAEVAPLRRACHADPTIGGRLVAVADSSGNAQSVVDWTDLTEDYCGVVPRVARLVEGAEDLLGRPVYHWHSKLSMKAPHSSGRWDWHQDYPYWYEEGCLRPDMVTCMIGIDPVTRANGCVTVLPGSHHYGRINHVPIGQSTGCDPVRLNLIQQRTSPVPVELAPGDACFFHANTLHASSGNYTDSARTILHCSYNAIDNSPFLANQDHHRYRPIATLPDSTLLDREWPHAAIWTRSIKAPVLISTPDGLTDTYGYRILELERGRVSETVGAAGNGPDAASRRSR